MKFLTLTILILMLISTLVLAETIYVPQQYPTIQEGINASQDGDTVLVANGVYTGLYNKKIYLSGREIIVKSESGPDNCIIDCQNSGIGFTLEQGETHSSIIEGFKIINGHNNPGYGNNAGAINIEDSSPTIRNCILTNNTANWDGGGICCLTSDAIIENCVITNNYSPHNGGGISIPYSSDVVLKGCVIADNNASGNGDGVFLYSGSHADIINCTIFHNGAYSGHGIYCYSSTIDVVNTVVSGYSLGVQFSSSLSTVHYSDFYQNSTNFSGSVPAGLGQITTTNYNGDPCDNYYNIFLNPLFQNPASYNFYLTENSPCIDAGDPSVLDPDMTISDIGAYYYDQVGAGIGTPFIILEPDTSTLMVPAQGDTVEFTVFAGYNPGWDLVDFWITLTYPDSQTVDTLLFIRQDVYVHQQDTLVRYPQYIVPPEAPSGTYTITGRGGIYPDTIQCEDSFTFEKLSSEGNYLANLPLEQIPPTTVALFAFPNPFNPQTTISFNLPQAGEVRLIAYDVLGREMAMLFNGFRDAGFYEITWNAENLPSGIYFVRLSVVGGQSAMQKIMLMK